MAELHSVYTEGRQLEDTERPNPGNLSDVGLESEGFMELDLDQIQNDAAASYQANPGQKPEDAIKSVVELDMCQVRKGLGIESAKGKHKFRKAGGVLSTVKGSIFK